MENQDQLQAQAQVTENKVSFFFNLNSIIELELMECELLGELRTLLSEHPLLKLHPNFVFKLQGKKLKEYVPLSEQIDSVESNLTINLALCGFNEKTAKEHVYEVSKLCIDPEKYLTETYSDFTIVLGRADFISQAITCQDIHQINTSVNEFNGTDLSTLQKCRFNPKKKNDERFFNNLSYSVFNPVDSSNSINGDLMYLDFVNLKGEYSCITVSSRGVYKNSSTRDEFNERQDSKSFYSLIELLSELSPEFDGDMNSLIRVKEGLSLNKLSFSNFSLNQTSEWLSNDKKNSLKLKSLLNLMNVLSNNKYGKNLVLYRDWIEEFHNCKLLPATQTLQQLHKLKILRKTHGDFVKASEKLAEAIVHNQLLPLNPNENRVESCYVYNNLFATYAKDRTDWELPKNETAPTTYSAVNIDIKNLNQIYENDLKDINVINTAAVDYMGRRVIVQSVIQGILHFDQKTWNCYGSIDDGKTMNFNEDFHVLMERLADYFHLTKDNKYKDEKSQEFTFHGSPEVKGIKAGDNRKYVMDLMRLSPRDLNYDDKKTNECCVLRPELISNYMFFYNFEENVKKQKAEQEKLRQEQLKKQEEEKKEIEVKEDQPKVEEKKEEEIKEQEKKVEELKEEEKKVEEPKEEEKKTVNEPPKLPRFNPSISTHIESVNANTEEEKANLKKISEFLTKNMIPTFINNLTTNSASIPLDSKDLADSLHKFGINIRYVGRIYSQLNNRNHTHYMKLIERFVIIRSLRKLLREVAIDESKQTYIECMVQYMNILLGNDLVRNMTDEKIDSLDNPKTSKKSKKNKKKRKFSSNDKEKPEISEYKRVNSAQLLKKINEIAEKRYSFPKNAFKTFESMMSLSHKTDKMAFLRDLCISLGVVIKHKNYEFEPNEKHLEYPIKARDVVNFKVKTKSAQFKMEGLKYNYKNAETEFNNKNLDAAFSMYKACQQLILSAYGLLNADFIYVTNKLATIMVMKGEFDIGIKTQLFVIKICEKFYGIDNTNTALNILSLSNFLYEKKEVTKSVNLHAKALKIFDLIGSDLNPNSLLCLHELLLMTEESKNYVTSAVITQELLDRNSRLFGDTDERLLFILAKLASIKSELGDFKDASILQARHMFILKQLLKINEKSLNLKYKEMLTKKLEESEKLKTYYVQKSKNVDKKEKTGLTPK